MSEKINETETNVEEVIAEVEETIEMESAAEAEILTAEEMMERIQELEQALADKEEINQQYVRLQADFDNFRKRTEKEKTQMFEVGAKSIIEKILPVVDNFERGLSAVPEEAKGDPFVEGMDKIYKQLMTELESLEVKPIEAVGTEFNPEFHNAVMQVESDEFESGVVAQELQKGYMYRESVVRHSMVAVVQ